MNAHDIIEQFRDVEIGSWLRLAFIVGIACVAILFSWSSLLSFSSALHWGDTRADAELRRMEFLQWRFRRSVGLTRGGVVLLLAGIIAFAIRIQKGDLTIAGKPLAGTFAGHSYLAIVEALRTPLVASAVIGIGLLGLGISGALALLARCYEHLSWYRALPELKLYARKRAMVLREAAKFSYPVDLEEATRKVLWDLAESGSGNYSDAELSRRVMFFFDILTLRLASRVEDVQGILTRRIRLEEATYPLLDKDKIRKQFAAGVLRQLAAILIFLGGYLVVAMYALVCCIAD